MLGTRFQSTVVLVQEAQRQDEWWFNNFVNTVDSAAPTSPGEFSSAYQRRDVARVNAMAEIVLQSQSSVSDVASMLFTHLGLPLDII